MPAKWAMRQLGLLASDHAREPLSEPGVRRVTALLERSPHVTLPS